MDLSDKALLAWGRRALRGLDESHVYVGVLNDHPLSAARVEFTLQLGHALLTEKPIILAVPQGRELPTKLRQIADRVVVYNPHDDGVSLTAGIAQALTEMGFKPQ
jgi:hypothetical protein